jgi:segregation and condensation protein B
MDDFDVQPILESLFFISESPIRLETLIEIIPESSKEAILEGIDRIKKEFAGDSKGMELVEVANGYQFRTKSKWAEWVHRLKKAKTVKLSRSALETLAIVAYRQPVIRPEIEEIRGVDSGWVLRTLLEKGLIKIMGRKEIVGRPIVYGTTKDFLELFGLNSLSDLPTLKEIQPSSIHEEIPKEEIKAEVEVKVKDETEDEELGVGSPEFGEKKDEVEDKVKIDQGEE